jgi:AraC family transcriptional activator of pobA
MTGHGNLSLPELAARYNISDIYGASVAYFSSDEGGEKDLRAVTDRISCYELHLIRQGNATIVIGGKTIELTPGDLLVLMPFQSVECHFPDDVVTEGLLIESSFYESLSLISTQTDVRMPNISQHKDFVYHLDAEKMVEQSGIFQQIRKAIQFSHIYKMEMIRSLVHVCLLFISELPYGHDILGNDFRHKQDIFKIFLHLANNNFRHDRSIQFYADKLNMTTTYLSRIVREISGNTVVEHLHLLTYNEACRLIKSTDMTMGEISDALNFHDQSAFTNFFRLHSGCSPLQYRSNKTDSK